MKPRRRRRGGRGIRRRRRGLKKLKEEVWEGEEKKRERTRGTKRGSGEGGRRRLRGSGLEEPRWRRIGGRGIRRRRGGRRIRSGRGDRGRKKKRGTRQETKGEGEEGQEGARKGRRK